MQRRGFSHYQAFCIEKKDYFAALAMTEGFLPILSA